MKSCHSRELVLVGTDGLLQRFLKHRRFHVSAVWVLQNIHKLIMSQYCLVMLCGNFNTNDLAFEPTFWCVYWPSSWACRCEFGLRPGRICVGVSGFSLWFPSYFHRCWSTGVHHVPGMSWSQKSGRNGGNTQIQCRNLSQCIHEWNIVLFTSRHISDSNNYKVVFKLRFYK